MAKAKAKKSASGGPIYEVKVTLEGSKPPIWRRLLIASTLTLADLHDVLQLAMGWTNSHLHQFKIGNEYYSMPGPYELEDTLDASRVKLGEVVTGPKFKFHYEYDMGDSWSHLILVEKVLDPNPSLAVPSCLAGKRACPPEDCGGVWGYADFLAAIADPKHPEHDDMIEWSGGAFDPEAFNLETTNAKLRQLG